MNEPTFVTIDIGPRKQERRWQNAYDLYAIIEQAVDRVRRSPEEWRRLRRTYSEEEIYALDCLKRGGKTRAQHIIEEARTLLVGDVEIAVAGFLGNSITESLRRQVGFVLSRLGESYQEVMDEFYVNTNVEISLEWSQSQPEIKIRFIQRI